MLAHILLTVSEETGNLSPVARLVYFLSCASASSSLSVSERVYKTQGEQSDFKDAGNPEGIPSISVCLLVVLHRYFRGTKSNVS